MSRPAHSLNVRILLWATDPDYVKDEAVKNDDASICAAQIMTEEEGARAFRKGLALWECPYGIIRDPELFTWWRTGWISAEAHKKRGKVKEVK